MNRRKWTVDQIEQIYAMRRNGKTLAEIGDQLGKTHNAVSQALMRYPEGEKTFAELSKKTITDKEKDTLYLLSIGKTSEEIRMIQGCTIAAVERRIFRLSSRIGTTSRTATVAYALRQGLIE